MATKKVRKDVDCFSFEKVFDSGLINFKDLVDSIVEQYPPGYMEVAHRQYQDDILRIFLEIKTDQELMYMFERHVHTNVAVMFIVYTDPFEPFHPITEWPSEELGTQKETKNNTQSDADNYLQNPLIENEFVGVDEKVMYLTSEPVTDVNVAVTHAQEKDREYGTEEDEDDSESKVEEEELAYEEGG